MTLASLPPLSGIALLLGAGAAAQWLAWRLRIPAILLLLVTGFVVGPVTGLLDPDRLFGESFRGLVSIAVGLILFEGGLTLRFRELRGAGKVVRNLVTLGALLTWLLGSLAAVYVAGVGTRVAILVGAILVLTGPTVVIPLVRHVRPRPPLGAILRWEGILIDPIGALLAVLVLEALTSSVATSTEIALGITRTLLFGGGLGLLGGYGLAKAIERFLVPDMLHVPVTFGVVTVTFVVANLLQAEAGLLAVTVMGIVMANRSNLDVEHIAEWKEQLSTVLLSVLFLSIAARIPLDQLTQLGWKPVLYTAVLVLLVRPLAVLASTLFTGTPWADRAFLMAMAPRGIVVAAVSSEFSLHFEQSGLDDGGTIVALVFPVIVLTVVVYGFAAGPIARALGIAKTAPQGVLIVGADLVGRELGSALVEQELEVLMVDTNARNTAAARTSGLRTWHGSVLSPRFAEEAELAGIGNALAVTPSDEINRLAMQQLLPTFGRAGLFRLPPAARHKAHEPSPGRLLFRTDVTIEQLRERLQKGARIKATRITEHFGPEEYRAHYGEQAWPLFVLAADGSLQVVTAGNPPTLKVGCTVIALSDPIRPAEPKAAQAEAARPDSPESPPGDGALAPRDASS